MTSFTHDQMKQISESIGGFQSIPQIEFIEAFRGESGEEGSVLQIRQAFQTDFIIDLQFVMLLGRWRLNCGDKESVRKFWERIKDASL